MVYTCFTVNTSLQCIPVLQCIPPPHTPVSNSLGEPRHPRMQADRWNFPTTYPPAP